ncbi:MAG: hypothetical protein IJ588_11045 [Prevotella sp.]|nr:hypothetical protein [Prevotella sp.]
MNYFSKSLVNSEKNRKFAAKSKNISIMTALANKISETPMAPYAEVLRNMKPSEMQIVVTFLQEAMAEAQSPTESPAEIIRNKFQSLAISQETKDLVRDLSLSAEEMNDERTQYILGYKQ